MLPCLDEAQALAFVAGTLPPESRRSFEEHVDGCDACRRVLAALLRSDGELASAPTALGTPALAPAASSDEPWPPGHMVGRYLVRGRLGRGGMGTVYRAEDSVLVRPVALKRLHATADGETRARLIREARTAAQLAHPNVVTIYEVGDDAGTPFLAMELVDGVTLTAWLAETPRSWRDATAMLAQAGRGLAAAHARGLVHRDFKPDNVLIERAAAGDGAAPRAGRARVADFGLARAGADVRGVAATADARLGRLTETGALAGTPAYLAPELVAGEPPDARSDQYAFAISLYEGLHGRHPFAGTTAAALWSAMAAGEIRPSARPVPAWLDRHVRRGLAVEPAARFPDLASFVAAIEPPAKRRIGVLVAAGAAVVAAATSVALVIAHRAPPVDRCASAGAPITRAWTARRSPAVAALGAANPAVVELDAFADRWRLAATDACRAHDTGDLGEARAICLDRARIRVDAIVDDVTAGGSAAIAGAPASADALPDLTRCADLPRLRRGEARPISQDEKAALDKIEHDLAHAEVLRDRGDLPDALALVTAAHTRAHELDAAELETRSLLARVELDRDRGDMQAATEDAVDAFGAAIATGQDDLELTAKLAMIAAAAAMSHKSGDDLPEIPSGAPSSRETASLYGSLGETQEARGKFVEAEAAFRKAQDIRAKLLPADHVERLLGDFEIAGALVMEHRDAEALPMLEQVRAGLDRRVAPLRREALDLLHAIGIAQAHLGHTDAAIAADRELLARRTQIFGEHSAMAAIARDELASALDTGGDYAGAAAARETAIADGITATNATSVNAAQARVNLAQDQAELGRYDDAIATLALARPILVDAKGADHVQVAIADLALADAKIQRAAAAHRQDGLADAAALLARVEPRFAASFGDHGAPMAAVRQIRGRLAAALGRWADADRAYADTLALLGDHPSPADRAEVELDRADSLAHLGHAAEARASADAAAADYDAGGAGFAARAARASAWGRPARASVDAK